MSPKRSDKLSQATEKSPQETPIQNAEAIQRKLRVRTWLSQVQDDGHRVDEQKDCNDVYTFIASHDADKDRGDALEITDNGLDESDEDGEFECSSIASGPSFLYHTTLKKLKMSWLLCSACQKLYEMAKRTKAPIKNKLKDYDPQSLTCDQWMLIKKWVPKKQSDVRRKYLRDVQVKKDREAHVGTGATSPCSRPHVFLQRNLRLCSAARPKTKRKNVKKRTRKNSQNNPVAKQRRLQSNDDHEPLSVSRLDDSLNGHFTSRGCGSRQIKILANAEVIPSLVTRETKEANAEVIPYSVTRETKKQKDVGAKQEAPKKTSGFRELLVQLRGNRIIRENH